MSQGSTLVAVVSSGLDVELSQQVWGKRVIGSGDIGVHQGSWVAFARPGGDL